MKTRSLISIQDLLPEEVQQLVDEGCALEGREALYAENLSGKTIGLYFKQPSTRTRTSFFLAIERMGGKTIQYGPGDLQLENGESIEDTAMIFDQCLDVIVARTNGPESELRRLAKASSHLAVINALSAEEHPTQAIADLITVQQEFGSLAGRHMLYVGAANNTSSSLLLAATRIPKLQITIATPSEFSQPAHIIAIAQNNAKQSGAKVSVVNSLAQLPAQVDVVYTARWQSMGKEPKYPHWRKLLNIWRVDEDFMQRVGNSSTVFMHDLPASRGDEVTNAVMDGASSRIRRQAHNKTIAAMVVLTGLVVGRET